MKIRYHVKKSLVSVLMAVSILMGSAAVPALPGTGLFAVEASAATTYTYYKACKSSYRSIVDALYSIGVNGSFSNRKKIAALNGISNYSGTYSQNVKLLGLLKNGKLIKSVTNTVTTPNPPGRTDPVITNFPASRATEVKPIYTSSLGARSANTYNRVINQFNVTKATRYARTAKGLTWCNIFAWDVCSAMNVKLPHWVMKNGTPATSADRKKGAWEMNANETFKWLANYGSRYGWKKVSAKDAQARANRGFPTVVIWRNASSGSGHVAIVRPEAGSYKYSSRGPVIAQAGLRNFNYGNVKDGFGNYTVVYYTHD